MTSCLRCRTVPYQTHPDPLGNCAAEVRNLLKEALAVHRPLGVAVGFYDFTSVSSGRSWRVRPTGRSGRVKASKKLWPACRRSTSLPMPCCTWTSHGCLCLEDGDLLLVDACPAAGCRLLASGFTTCRSRSCLVRFQVATRAHASLTIVVAIDSTEVAQHVSVDKVSVAAAKGEGQVLVRRSPYGQPNKAPLDQRGWIYLSASSPWSKWRLVDETEASRVVFSNSRRVLDEILHGGMMLRRAAQDSESVLERTLKDFFDVLASKTFGGDFHRQTFERGLSQKFLTTWTTCRWRP